MMDKQKEILNAALKLFVEFGFHGTPTSKIAKEADVANGTLFHYYKTKDDLILALYKSIKMGMSDYIYKSITTDTDYLEILKIIYFNTLEWASVHKEEFYFVQQFNTSPFLSLVSSDEITYQAKPHIELIEAGIKNKVFKNLPKELLYILINNHLYGISIYLQSEEFTPQKRKKIMNETFDLLLAMISEKSFHISNRSQ